MFIGVRKHVEEYIDKANIAVPGQGAAALLKVMTILSNISAKLFYSFNARADPNALLAKPPVNWCGFYLMESPTHLVLGPFQGRPACQRIKVGDGVCGTAVLHRKDQCIGDVHEVECHIACDEASNAEAVVLFRHQSTIFGVLDIDSTVKNFFSEEDMKELRSLMDFVGEKLAPLIQPPRVVEPSSHAIPGTNLHATRLGTKATAFHVESTHNHAATTTITQPPVQTGGPHPTQQMASVGGWEMRSTTFDRMMSSTKFAEWEGSVGVKQLPEIIFDGNSLDLTLPVKKDTSLVGHVNVHFDARAALKNAAAYYQTPAYEATKSNVSFPSTDGWREKQKKYTVFDPQIDWAFRNNYCGTFRFVGENTSHELQSLSQPPEGRTMKSIDYDMLKDQQLPIKFYALFDLFEDDLHDAGLSKLSVRFRAMETGFFALVRFVVRIDGVSLTIRDSRVFHSFDCKEIVLEETVKRITVDELISQQPHVDGDTLRRLLTDTAEAEKVMKEIHRDFGNIFLPQ